MDAQRNLPEIGQVVKVRDRHWAVAEIIPSGLPPDIVRPGGDLPDTLVTLSSVEDDGQAESLTVARKVETIRHDLGSVGDVLAQQSEAPVVPKAGVGIPVPLSTGA